MSDQCFKINSRTTLTAREQVQHSERETPIREGPRGGGGGGQGPAGALSADSLFTRLGWPSNWLRCDRLSGAFKIIGMACIASEGRGLGLGWGGRGGLAGRGSEARPRGWNKSMEMLAKYIIRSDRAILLSGGRQARRELARGAERSRAG